jgi:hypothetical protein
VATLIALLGDCTIDVEKVEKSPLADSERAAS